MHVQRCSFQLSGVSLQTTRLILQPFVAASLSGSLDMLWQSGRQNRRSKCTQLGRCRVSLVSFLPPLQLSSVPLSGAL
eukprot:scaffold10457_cov22-Tisochrysis_lutea.AAC.4